MLGLKGPMSRFGEVIKRFLPGVHIGEMASHAKPIAGVELDATAFVGPTLTGLDGDLTAPVHNYPEFEQRFGGAEPLLDGNGNNVVNFVALGAKAFFDNGGRTLYVAPTPNWSVANFEQALTALESVPDIGLVAAPGYSTLAVDNYPEMSKAMVRHAEKMRHRFALIDPPPGRRGFDLVHLRNQFSSNQAIMYTPWVRVDDQSSSSTVTLPPSPFIAGIIARVDRQRGIYKAPANELIKDAIGLEQEVTDQEQTLLHPLGINALRYIPDKGYLVWGARTLSDDPEWKYVNVRRYFVYLEQSIAKGTQWAVSEPNAEPLWNDLQQSITQFMHNEWRSGGLQGAKPEQAFFVRCDRSTMTTQDLSEGRTVCMVGFAPLKPAEFIIFRVTIERRVEQ